ncbi:MAG: DUF3995 domain-containing protein [Pseudomonadota bacterium]
MRNLGYLIAVILTVIALIHAYWAFGGLWPGHDVQSLINAVMGDPNRTKMPPTWLTLLVAGLIGATALIGWSAGRAHRNRGIGPMWLNRIGAGGVGLVFVARAVLGFLIAAGYVALPQTEPFASLDLRFYSPLCLALGLGFWTLAFMPRTQRSLSG